MASYRLLAAAAAGAGGTAGTGRGAVAAGAVSTHGVLGFHDESVIGHVNFDIAGLIQQFLFHEEGESTGLGHVILIVRLIQSQGQARARSAAGREIHADRGRFLVLEVAFELLLGSFSDFDHYNAS